MAVSVQDRLLRTIATSGPVRFDEFMDLALYDADGGFYESPSFGWDGQFLTSPTVSPVFAELLAREIETAWVELGRPETFAVIDAGAGDGTLLRGLNSALDRRVRDASRLVAVERSRTARRLIETNGFEVVPDLSALTSVPAGVIVANELLDNLPFRRLRRRDDGSLWEIAVGVDAGRLSEVELPADPLIAADASPAPGEAVVRPGVEIFVAEIARILRSGYALVIDYASTQGRTRGYRRHRLVDDLLLAPGTADITADVDMDEVARHARATGLVVHGPVSQRSALMALGFRHAFDSMRRRQRLLEREGRWRDALRLFSARQGACALVDEHGLGSHQVLVLATPDAKAPSIVSAPRGRL